MNNNDRYQIALRTDPLEAAALALQFSAGCGSRARAWDWAKDAIDAAAEGGVELDAGNLSWPDLDAMTKQLQAPHP